MDRLDRGELMRLLLTHGHFTANFILLHAGIKSSMSSVNCTQKALD